ncbi:MAG: hypothetical protein ACP5R2_10450 [Anaerolineae bacterium]
MTGEIDRDQATYITIVEGPPPRFKPVDQFWTASLAEGPVSTVIALCDMRTLNGPGLVERCRRAWAEGRPARLDYPVRNAPYAPTSTRAEIEIVAARWSEVKEGQVLTLWVRTDNSKQLFADEDGPEE